jgi:hypothetical protein
MTVSAYWGVQSNAPQSVNKSVNMTHTTGLYSLNLETVNS